MGFLVVDCCSWRVGDPCGMVVIASVLRGSFGNQAIECPALVVACSSLRLNLDSQFFVVVSNTNVVGWRPWGLHGECMKEEVAQGVPWEVLVVYYMDVSLAVGAQVVCADTRIWTWTGVQAYGSIKMVGSLLSLSLGCVAAA